MDIVEGGWTRAPGSSSRWLHHPTSLGQLTVTVPRDQCLGETVTLPCPEETPSLTSLFTKVVRCADFYWQYGCLLCATVCAWEDLVYTSVRGWSCCALWGGRKVCAGRTYYSSSAFPSSSVSYGGSKPVPEISLRSSPTQ